VAKHARLQQKRTEYPGERTLITLDVSQVGLDALLAGSDVDRVWLEPNDDGTYSLRADSLLRDTKAHGVKPAITFLIELLNEFGDVLDAHEAKTPEEVNRAFEHLTERWNNYSGEFDGSR
jgi:hypothetical protein